ncbi:MAG: pyruvate, water dikinase regulatory protein [Pyramidobacter piscolens]
MSTDSYELFSSEAEQNGVKLEIFIVSDFTGETAESVTRAALRQFDEARHVVALHRFRTVDTIDKLINICWQAKENKAIIVCTLVAQSVREALMRYAGEMGLKVIDLIGPTLDTISARLGIPPKGTPGSQHKLDEAYFRRVKALEFSSTCDDGANPNLLPEAELVIVGVSRTCKTPLSMYLANKGIRTANVPLVPELAPPDELFTLPHGRIVGLVIQPDALRKIRRERLQIIGLDPDKAFYAQEGRVKTELDYARYIMERLQIKAIDVTGRALEETAQVVLDYLREQGCPALLD